MWFFHNPGLLGINARNLLYIKAYNPKKAIMMADSKLKTKHYLSARGIPVAKLYAVIRNKSELEQFSWDNLPNSFVVKPNSGYGGEGILVVSQKNKNGEWVLNDGKILSPKTFKRHISNILDGRYSLSDLTDQVLFEQKLEAPEWLTNLSYKGLPDIRIIVHNLIPVMAMLRLPTRLSHGKANLHMGGIGIGIDIASGNLTHITQFNKIIPEIPGVGPVNGISIPEWYDLLLIASKVQQMTNLGFAAIDLTLDKNAGVVLLEINARAGLAVQIANLAPLRRRLERVEGIRVGTPEKGVRIAQDIFGHKTERKTTYLPEKIIIGPQETVKLLGNEKAMSVLAKIDPHAEKSLIDKTLTGEFLENGRGKLTLMGKRITTIMEGTDLSAYEYKVILSKRDIRDFWIDPEKAVKKGATPSIKSPRGERSVDMELIALDKQIHLLSHLRPINLDEEIEIFLGNPSYNPQFRYKPLEFDIEFIRSRLRHLDFPEGPIGMLFRKKAEEISLKIDLLEVRGSDSFTDIAKLLIPAPDQALIEEALVQITSMPSEYPKEAILPIKKVKERFEEVLKKAGLEEWKVQLKESMVADVVTGKEKIILIRTYAEFTENRLKGTIAHEIGTHVFTAMNGAMQPYKIFQRGLAGYLETQEGLAVINQEKTEAIETSKRYWPASSVIGIDAALKGGFAEMCDVLRRHGFSSDRALKVALKTKRGMSDTGKPGGFTKDVVYFRGKKKILDFVEKGGDMNELYIGKINLDDLPVIRKIKNLKPPHYVPEMIL